MSCLNRHKKGFTILELIAAMSVFIMLVGCFYTSLRGVYRLQRVYEAETNAMVVINNLLERIEPEETKTFEKIKVVLEDEFQKSSLSKDNQFSQVCIQEKDVIVVRIMRQNNHALAKVELKQ